MQALTKSLMKCAGMLAAGLLHPAASSPAFAQGTPQIISNTAMVEWTVGGQTLSRPSNTVQFAVEAAPDVSPSVALLRFSSAPGASSQTLPPTICAGGHGPAPITFSGVYSNLPVNPASLLPATTIRAGEPLVFQVGFATRNVDPGAIDQFEVEIATPNGDRERITLTESAENSGRFNGFINTKATPPPLLIGDCALSVRPGDTVNVKIDESGPAVSSVRRTCRSSSIRLG